MWGMYGPTYGAADQFMNWVTPAEGPSRVPCWGDPPLDDPPAHYEHPFLGIFWPISDIVRYKAMPLRLCLHHDPIECRSASHGDHLMTSYDFVMVKWSLP